ncbi:phosphatase PAP2 family protein [uncultured Tateyamaria sp.]|uniref:phosphatase PAP2 family protein n=1 Tax=uncultured Tateyamaria sp. TaxID=455651 RepID=UPI0026268BAB|nr:phosphatase PAP2 family protein [uncultured Tateyamaria sp.]
MPFYPVGGALQSAAMALVHHAGTDDVTTDQITPLAPNATAHMERWSPNVRAMLLQMEFLQGFNTSTNAASRPKKGKPTSKPVKVTLSWQGAEFGYLYPASADTLAAQLPIVRAYADQRGDRTGEVLSQLDYFTDFYLTALGIPAGRAAHLIELILVTQLLSGLCSMPAKHMLACRRPDELDSRIMSLIPSPSHGSLPSGHGTQAVAIATVLNTLLTHAGLETADMRNRQRLVLAQSHRIAVNRTVAGVHYPMDNWAGAVIGRAVGEIIVAMGIGTTRTLPVLQADPNAPNSQAADFALADLKLLFDNPDAKPLVGVQEVPARGGKGAVQAVDLGGQSDLFAWLWGKALEDIQHVTGRS